MSVCARKYAPGLFENCQQQNSLGGVARDTICSLEGESGSADANLQSGIEMAIRLAFGLMFLVGLISPER